MTIRLDMRSTVKRAPGVLGDSAEAVRDFLRRQLMQDGGFRGRDECSDLYYTVFGLEASLALEVDIPRERGNDYLAGFGTGESLDLVHLASLIRCRANVSSVGDPRADAGTRNMMVEHVMEYRAADGGFSVTPGAERGSAYGSFLAMGACQDLDMDCPDAARMAESIASLQRPEGGYANEATMIAGATPATAAAISVLHYFKQPVPESAVQWLLTRAHPHGGFTAIPFGGDLGVPDLLSTATALHALALVGAPLDNMRDTLLDYLDSLWSAQGGFRGHWADEAVDCEYTYYGLLALGTLAE
jgi:prenyltransferase beta subunit